MTNEQRITILVALKHMLDDSAKCRDNAQKQLAKTGDPYWQESIDYWQSSHQRYLSAHSTMLHLNTIN
jgi:hypothetical protein